MSIKGVALSTALLLALTGLGLAQDNYRDRDDRGTFAQPQSENHAAYQNGLRDGVNDGIADRQSSHSFRATQQEKYEDATSGYNAGFGSKDRYKNAYRQGYMDGYQRGYNGNPSAAAVYGQAGTPVYGQTPVYGTQSNPGQQAYGNGYQEGLRDGAADMQSGHSFRPMDNDHYKHANDGYITTFGDRDQYKQSFRQGYAAGYQQGFNGSAANTGAATAYPAPAPGAPMAGQPVAGPVYGQPAVGMQNQAYQAGFQDGVNDGAGDHQAGRGFRPEKREHYEHADTGYNSSFGDKDQYKQAYRDGYMAGYRRGFGK